MTRAFAQAELRRSRAPLQGALRALALTLALLVAGAAAAQGTRADAPSPERTYQLARNAFRFGDYDQAITLLDGLLSPRVLLQDPEDVREALRLLGIAGHLRGDTDTARAAFVRLLSIAPDFHLDPLVVPPRVVEFFEGIRRELAQRLEAFRLRQELERGQGGGEPAPQGWRLRNEQVVVERNPLWINFLPLGLGEFQLGRRGWGSFFFIGQTLALGADVAGYALVEGSRGDDGKHSPEDYERARDIYQPMQLAALITLGVFYAWSVVDSLVHWEPERRVTRRWEQELPPGTEPPPLDEWLAPPPEVEPDAAEAAPESVPAAADAPVPPSAEVPPATEPAPSAPTAPPTAPPPALPASGSVAPPAAEGAP